MARSRTVLSAALLTVLAGAHAVPAAFDGATSSREYPAGRPPWYRGELPQGARVAAVPVQVEVPPGTPDGWLPEASLGRLAARMTERLREQGRVAMLDAALPSENGPALYLGCSGDPADAAGECDRTARGMVFRVTHGSKRWREAARPIVSQGNADHLLLLRLGVSDHWLTQRDWKGNKEIPLGSGFSQPVPWLTSLDTPVTVLQLTGVVVNGDGKVVRSGIEGLTAVRTRFGESALGLQRVLRDEDVAALESGARWHEALDRLVEALVP